jgi:ABC-type uncharacterized transport system substrate-binding protein
VYILEGAFTLEMEGRAPVTIKAGQAMVEPPNVKMTGHNFAEKHRISAMYESGTLAQEGGLMSYGANPDDNFRRAASYVDRIFEGATPDRLPVERPIRYFLAINL